MEDAEYVNGSISIWSVAFSFWAYVLMFPFQIFSIIHVVRGGRNYFWIWPLLAFPMITVPIYFYLEIWPDIKRGEFSLFGHRVNRKPSAREIRKMEEAVEDSYTVQNRITLADAYLATNKAEKAYTLYLDCLGGPYRDDPVLLWGVAQSAFELGKLTETEEALGKLDALHWGDYRDLRKLLTARLHESKGNHAEALKLYEALEARFSGQEARCRFAMLLAKTGQKEKARALFQQILKDTRKQSGSYKVREKRWYKIAKRELAALEK